MAALQTIVLSKRMAFWRRDLSSSFSNRCSDLILCTSVEEKTASILSWCMATASSTTARNAVVSSRSNRVRVSNVSARHHWNIKKQGKWFKYQFTHAFHILKFQQDRHVKYKLLRLINNCHEWVSTWTYATIGLEWPRGPENIKIRKRELVKKGSMLFVIAMYLNHFADYVYNSSWVDVCLVVFSISDSWPLPFIGMFAKEQRGMSHSVWNELHNWSRSKVQWATVHLTAVGAYCFW